MDGSQTASSYYYDGLLGNGQGYKVDSHYKETDNITITLITDNRSLKFSSQWPNLYSSQI